MTEDAPQLYLIAPARLPASELAPRLTAVLDGLGAQLDLQTAQQFDPDLLRGMVVGRPPSDTPSGNR